MKLLKGSGLTIVDVAERAGVSVSTVSRVLNSKSDVARATRERVEA
ncbi:LacI family DNA-binding transcriptional regulator, partial [Salinibacterium sp.]